MWLPRPFVTPVPSDPGLDLIVPRGEGGGCGLLVHRCLLTLRTFKYLIFSVFLLGVVYCYILTLTGPRLAVCLLPEEGGGLQGATPLNALPTS